MRRCVTAVRPFALPTPGAILNRAGLLWLRLMSALSDPYRPEQHYMRGPGPKYFEREARERTGEPEQGQGDPVLLDHGPIGHGRSVR
jgi:hypothetical protein